MFTHLLAKTAAERHARLAIDHVLHEHAALGIHAAKTSEDLSRFVAQEAVSSIVPGVEVVQLPKSGGLPDAEIVAARRTSKVAIKGGRWFSWGKNDRNTDLVIVVTFDFLGDRPCVATILFVPTTRLDRLAEGSKPKLGVFADEALVIAEADLAAPLPPSGRLPIDILTGGMAEIGELRRLLS